MHTKDKLAAALTEAGLPGMAAKAATGYYHDFLSPLALPSVQLIDDLGLAGGALPEPVGSAARALRERAMNGDFDATIEESEAWAESVDGQDTMRSLLGNGDKIRGR